MTRTGAWSSAMCILGLVAISAIVMIVVPSDECSAGAEEDRGVYNEVGDETRGFTDARELQDGDRYYGSINKVVDRRDFFKVDALYQDVLNVHIYIIGHDGTTEWNDPRTSDITGIYACYLYVGPNNEDVIDGSYLFPIRDYCLNICCPVPGTNTYYINVSMDWINTPNNFTWDYYIEVDLSDVPVIESGEPERGTIDLDSRDAHWYKIHTDAETVVNGTVELLNFNPSDPEERNIDIWIFPDDLGGYPEAEAWDWSAAPNEPIEPVSILAPYEGWYYIKLRGMNHDNNLPCEYQLLLHTTPVEVLTTDGVVDRHLERTYHDTDWYMFRMTANHQRHVWQGLWNEVIRINMTERADSDNLPDFDLYLFGRTPWSGELVLLDSSIRGDHSDFFDPDRDPTRNNEVVRAAAFYNGTYYLEVSAYNNSGYYDLVFERMQPRLSDEDNVPVEGTEIGSGVFEGHLHQALDHFDWYQVRAYDYLKVQFDSFKSTDLFNVSVYRYDTVNERFVFLAGGWNTWFNHTDGQDYISNLVTVELDLQRMGLPEDTYYVACIAAVAAQMAYDEITQGQFLYKTDSDAEADYELRVWGGWDPPPPPTIPFEVLVLEEDTDAIEVVDLKDHFIDDDVGGEPLRFKIRIIKGRLERIELEDGIVSLYAADDFVGSVVLLASAIDSQYLQTTLTWNVIYTPVNDPPRIRPPGLPISISIAEDSLAGIDLNDYVFDIDEDDVLGVASPIAENLAFELIQDSLVGIVSGAPDWYGEEVVVFRVWDLEHAVTEVPVRFVVENVGDDPITLALIGDLEMLEDTSMVLDMGDYFSDPDGDRLDFSLSTANHIHHSVDPSRGLVTLAPEPDWYGSFEVEVTATDPDGRSVQQRFRLYVINQYGPLRIAVHPPHHEQTMNESSTLSFAVVEATSEDSSVFVYRWFLDDIQVGASPFYQYEATFDDQGPHGLKVEVTDEFGLVEGFTWKVLVLDVPRPPTGGIASPMDGERFSIGETIEFLAIYQDPDGDTVAYQWFVDGVEVSNEASFGMELGPGVHPVTLVVTSGEHLLAEHLNVTVDSGASAKLWSVASLAMVVTVAVATVTWVLIRRKGTNTK